MATTPQLKNTLSFDLAAGASVVLPHGLSNGQRPLAPDIVFIPSPDLSVTADEVAVTLTNGGGSQLTGAVLVEAWHTIERAFGDVANEDLPIKPYVVVSVEGGNQPPIPPFVATRVYIFANVDGNDNEGTGSEEKPYLTFQRAVRDVPPFIPPSVQYVIDITNLGDEELPADYALPAWVGSRTFFDSNVMIIAKHEPLRSLSEADRQVTVTAASADFTTKTIQVTDLSKNWDPDSLKGQFLSFGDPADPLISVIYSNTSNTLLLSGNDGDPVVPEPGWEGMITEPSARFQASSAETPGGFHISSLVDIYIAGIRVEDLNDPEAFSFIAAQSGIVIERSQIIRGWFQNAPRQAYFVSCYGLGMSFDTRLYLSRSYIVDSGAGFTSPAQVALMIHSGTVLENTLIQIGLPAVAEVPVGGGLAMSGVLIKNAPSDAVKMIGGTGTILGVRVDDTQEGNAFTFIGPCKYVLGSVLGTNNANLGVFCTDGAQIECRTIAGVGDGVADKILAFPDDGVMVLIKVGAGFKQGASTIVITGSANPLVNDGTFPVFDIIDDDTVVYGNPIGVTEDPFSGFYVVDPVAVLGNINAQQVGDLPSDAWPAVPFNIVDFFGGVNPNATGTGARLFNK